MTNRHIARVVRLWHHCVMPSLFEHVETKRCKRCGEAKPLDAFAKQKFGHMGVRTKCKDCINREWVDRMSNPDALAKDREQKRLWRRANRESTNARIREWHLRQKIACFEAYGGCHCVRCGMSDIRCLSIDHIAGNGAEHRREIMPDNPRCAGGRVIWMWLRRNGYPPGFQVLCMNCQWIKRDEQGECKRSNRGG